MDILVVAGEYADQHQDVKAIIALEEVRRLDRLVEAAKEEMSETTTQGES